MRARMLLRSSGSSWSNVPSGDAVGPAGPVGAEVSVLLTGLIGTVDWAAARSMLGGSAFVPESLARLLRAESDEEAEAAYWELDNRVVVQGQLFDAARLLVGPLVSALQTRLAPSARRQVVDLLVEIALGTPDQSELLLGNEVLPAWLWVSQGESWVARGVVAG